MKHLIKHPPTMRQPVGRKRRLAALHIGAGLAVIATALAGAFLLQLRTRAQQATPAKTQPATAQPIYVTENTPFGRRVHLVTPAQPTPQEKASPNGTK